MTFEDWIVDNIFYVFGFFGLIVLWCLWQLKKMNDDMNKGKKNFEEEWEEYKRGDLDD